MDAAGKPRLAPRLAGLAALAGTLWYGYVATWVPLCLLLGTACALYSLRVAEEGEARYGRRVTVTEMLPLGRAGDRAMLLGGLAGWLMLPCFVLAAWLAF